MQDTMQEERSFIVSVVAIYLYHAFNFFFQNSSYLYNPYIQNNGNYTKGTRRIEYFLIVTNGKVTRHEWYSGLDLADIAQILL